MLTINIVDLNNKIETGQRLWFGYKQPFDTCFEM